MCNSRHNAALGFALNCAQCSQNTKHQMKSANSIFYVLSTLAFGTMVLSSCNENVDSKKPVNAEKMAAGFQLMENNCFSCHNPNHSSPVIVAPDFAKIKSAYLNESNNYEEFSNSLIRFLSKPSIENSVMPDNIEKYGLMPRMNFKESQYSDMAYYLYNSSIENSNWFSQNYQDEKIRYANNADTLSYEEMGLQLAMKTKEVLGKNLLNAINTKGTEHAVDFCSTRALVITDSMAFALDAKIKRVSDKNRNLSNAADSVQNAYIQYCREELLNGNKPQPKRIDLSETVVCLYPIITEDMCLKCHGNIDTDINSATLSTIKNRYPTDKATGYKSQEIRGAWVVEMKNK